MMNGLIRQVQRGISWGWLLIWFVLTEVTEVIIAHQAERTDSISTLLVRGVLLASLALSFLYFGTKTALDRYVVLYASILILPFSRDYVEQVIRNPIVCMQGVLLFLLLATLSVKVSLFSTMKRRFLFVGMTLIVWYLFALVAVPYTSQSIFCEAGNVEDAVRSLAAGIVRVFGYIPTVTLLTGTDGLLASVSLMIVFVVTCGVILAVSYRGIFSGFERALLLLIGVCHTINLLILTMTGSLNGSLYVWPTIGLLLLTGFICDRVWGERWKQVASLVCGILFVFVLVQGYKLYYAQLRVYIFGSLFAG